MGLFSHRPEEPTEWAGLPSEPATSESLAERLTDAATLDAVVGSAAVLLGDGAIESIVIPVAPIVEIAETQGSAEGS
jgi:hypothetical protein